MIHRNVPLLVALYVFYIIFKRHILSCWAGPSQLKLLLAIINALNQVWTQFTVTTENDWCPYTQDVSVRGLLGSTQPVDLSVTSFHAWTASKQLGSMGSICLRMNTVPISSGWCIHTSPAQCSSVWHHAVLCVTLCSTVWHYAALCDVWHYAALCDVWHHAALCVTLCSTVCDTM